MDFDLFLSFALYHMFFEFTPQNVLPYAISYSTAVALHLDMVYNLDGLKGYYTAPLTMNNTLKMKGKRK